MFHARHRKRNPLFAPLVALAALFGLAAMVLPHAARADMTLLMVEQTHCEWCEAWNEEIGGVYARTEEGRRAPLRRQNLFDPWPADLRIQSQIHFTPTFILLRDGHEVGRIEGYPGEHFFWPMLAQLLNRTPRDGPPTKGDDS